MISRSFASVFPRQSPSSLIFSSIDAEADFAATGLFMSSSNSRSYFGCAQRNLQPPQGEASRLRVRNCATRRPFRNKPSKDMAFPHPQSRKQHYGNDDKPNTGGVLWKVFKRIVNIAGYRDAKDEVNPAKDRTFGGIFHLNLSSI